MGDECGSNCSTTTHSCGGDDLSEDIWMKIIQYNHLNILDGSQSSVSGLFRVLPYVSKQMHRICNEYAKITPLDLPSGVIGNPKLLPMIEWMCRKRVKIRDFSANSYHDINSVWLRIIVYMLVSCNTSEMTSFSMKCDFSLVGSRELGTIVDAEEAGIPAVSLQYRYDDIIDEYDHQALLANTLLEQASSSLKSLSLMVQDNSWHRLFLENFLHSVESLEFYAYAGEFDSYSYNENHGVGDMIENMSSLKRLTLTGEFRGSMAINSISLEEINIIDMSKHSDFVVECCICPLLERIRCAWDAEHGVCIGLEPIAPLSEFELNFDEDGSADILVQHRPFHGLLVSPTCIVSLLRKRFLL
mmetsp:Transcript_28623/g.42424  ORF Transcript_28623/g.42424 Transcript_28623/m.42424 type:complete len:358 (-) Transcript_28623:170-1243(-)